MAQTTALSPVQQIEQQLSRKENLEMLKKSLPSHIPAEKFVRVAVMALRKTPALADSNMDRASLYHAIQLCAQDGLLPDGREAALIPFGNKVQYIPMVAGLLKKVRNSGELKSITAITVFSKDSFKYWVDENGEHLKHEPDFMAERGEFKAVYALAQTKDGGIYVEILTKKEVEKVRAVSRAGNKGPWVDWYEEQAEKTVLKKICKRLPMSTDITGVIDHDEEVDFAESDDGSASPLGAPTAEAPGAGSKTKAAAAAAVAEAKPVEAKVVDEKSPPQQIEAPL